MTALLTLVEDEGPAVPQRQLWQTVIAQAVIEALMATPSRLRDEARHWLFESPYTFGQVCEFAGWNPEYIRKHTRGRIERNELFKHPPRLPRRDSSPNEAEELEAAQ